MNGTHQHAAPDGKGGQAAEQAAQDGRGTSIALSLPRGAACCCASCCGSCAAGGLCDSVQRLWSDPATWGRPCDQKKSLPEQWARQSSSWRYLHALVPYLGPPCYTLGHIIVPLTSIMALCVAIKLADGHIAWKLDQYNNYMKLYRLSSFVLSLLLAFRTNRTYDRWWQARSAFGGIGGGVVNIIRQAATYTDDAHLIRCYQKWGMCMVYGIVQLVRNTPHVTDPRVAQLLDEQELALYQSTTKPSKLCGTMLSALTSSAGFGVEREIHLNECLGAIAAHISMVARIKLQMMPYGLSLFCTGWLYIWLLLLPLGVFPEANWSALLPVGVMAAMMLGLEDLAVQLEDPFRFMPYEAMISTTAKDCQRTVAEVRSVKAMIQTKYAPVLQPHHAAACGCGGGGKASDAADLPPWPTLKPQPQLR